MCFLSLLTSTRGPGSTHGHPGEASCFLLISSSVKYSGECPKEYNIDTRININKFLSEKSETELTSYIEQFFVGLLEGDGTITVDYINNRKKRVRIVIALKNLEDNRFMLNLIVKHIGGRVAIERNDAYCV